MMVSAGDLVGGAILVAVFVVLIGAGEAWARLGEPAPEATRKLVHVGSGFESPWVVLAMAGSMSTFFGLASRSGFLASVHGVDRESRGSEYYPLAIFLVFLLTGDQLWIYVSSVLILALADASAALVGARWGRLRYTIQSDQKSVEGSLAFFAIAFAAIAGPAWLATSFSAPKIALSAGIGALLLTGFEAISLNGADNLFVPFAACVILQKHTADPIWMLADQALVLAGLLASLLVVNQCTALANRRRTALNGGATVASTMFAFAAWTLGGIAWAAPVLVLFACYTASWMVTQFFRRARDKIAVRTTYRALLLPFVVLVFANTSGDYAFWYGPFVAACATVLAVGLAAQLRRTRTLASRVRCGRTAFGLGTLAALAVVGLPWQMSPMLDPGAPAWIVATTGPLAALDAVVASRADASDDSFWVGSHFLVTTLAIVGTVAAQHYDVIGIVE
ncbi:MAG: hypothetical protein ABEN55_01260 [Bradymonadaceae bacterium]